MVAKIFFFIVSMFFCLTVRSSTNIPFEMQSSVHDSINSESSQYVKNIELLCKVWGFLKYYHPDLRKGKYNWDRELLIVMPNVINAKDNEELNQILVNWLNKFDFKSTTRINHHKIDSSQIVQFPNYSWMEDKIQVSTVLHDKLKNILFARRTSKNWYNISHNSLILKGSYRFVNEIEYDTIVFPDRKNYRLLSLFRYWNIIEYCFPYRYLTDNNWDEVLREFVPIFFNASNYNDYRNALYLLNAKTNDGHSVIKDKHNRDVFSFRFFAPYIFRNIDGKVVIDDKYNVNCNYDFLLKKGDVLISVNGLSVDSLVAERRKFYCGSHPQSVLNKASAFLLTDNQKSTYDVLVQRGETNKIAIVESVGFFNLEKNSYCKDGNEFLADSVLYLLPCNIKKYDKKYFNGLFKKSKSVIIDLRYFSDNMAMWEILENHLLPTKTEYSYLTKGSTYNPGLFYFYKKQKIGKRNRNHFKGKVVVIVDKSVVSSFEHLSLAFQSRPNTVVVGCHTAGANGPIQSFSLPGGFKATIGTKGVYYPDKSQLQRNGLKVDFSVCPTIYGLVNEQDELLNEAKIIALE